MEMEKLQDFPSISQKDRISSFLPSIHPSIHPSIQTPQINPPLAHSPKHPNAPIRNRPRSKLPATNTPPSFTNALPTSPRKPHTGLQNALYPQPRSDRSRDSLPPSQGSPSGGCGAAHTLRRKGVVPPPDDDVGSGRVFLKRRARGRDRAGLRTSTWEK